MWQGCVMVMVSPHRITLSPQDRDTLNGWVRAGATPQKLVRRAIPSAVDFDHTPIAPSAVVNDRPLLRCVTFSHNFLSVIFSAAAAAARWIAPALTVAVLGGAALPAERVQVGSGPAVRLVDAENPLAGQPFYVDPISAAMVAARNANPPSAELTNVANTPQAYWLDQAFSPATATGTVARHTGAAQAAGAMPVLTLYAIPHRDCGSYAAGGFATGADYRAWIDGVADGLGGASATIILEPDALAMADCLSGDQRQERFELISYAVDTLTRNPAAAVYIDGGHSRWVNADEMAARLNQAGVGRARGFSLNASNYYTTDEEIGYGEAISGMTNGAHYVIDTSRNGAGPAPEQPLNWCNPDGRALGTPPTTATAGAHADAYLWIKRVGESDGSCERGEPPAGRFVNQFAIDLARNAGQ